MLFFQDYIIGQEVFSGDDLVFLLTVALAWVAISAPTRED